MIFTPESTFFQTAPFIENDMVGRNEGEWNLSLARDISNLHDGIHRKDAAGNPLEDRHVPPKLLIVTAPTSVPYFYAIKACWAEAYPAEKAPIRCVLDVSNRRFGKTGTQQDAETLLSEEEIAEYIAQQIELLNRIGLKHDALENSAVFDEFRDCGETLMRVERLLKQAGFSDVNFLQGKCGLPYPGMIDDEENVVVRDLDQKPVRQLLVQVTKKSKALIRDMKAVGKLMGRQIVEHHGGASSMLQ